MVQEVISVVERRRDWSPEAKARILEEASRPGAVIASVLAKYNLAGSLFYRWRKQAREGTLSGISVSEDAPPPGFAPVMIAAPQSDSVSGTPRREPASVEVKFGNGRSLKVDEAIDPAVLKRLITAVDS
jgi:transposase